MFSGRKPTIAWVTVVAITISLGAISVVHAQKSSSPTFMDRFSAFKGVFKREESSTRKSASNSSRQTSSRKKTGLTTYGSRSRSATNSGSRKTSPSASLPRIELPDLLPNNFFGRKKSSSTSGNQRQQRSIAVPSNQRTQNGVVDDSQPPTESASRTASRTRKGSAVRSPSQRTRPRRSPKITRHDNLGDTLSDLLENEVNIFEQVVIESDELTASQRESEQLAITSQEPVAIATEEATEQLSPESAAIASDDYSNDYANDALASESAPAEEEPIAHTRFDLHDALLSDELYEDLAAEEVALEEITAEITAAETQPSTTPIVDSRPAEIENSLEIESLIEANSPESFREQSLPFDRVVESPQPFEALPEPLPTPIAELEEPVVANKRTQVALTPRASAVQRKPTRRDPLVLQDNKPTPITRLRKPSSEVLVSTEQPVIVSHVEGPRSILVGREASYRVTLENTSRTPAQNLSAAIHVPDWADLVDVTSTSGVVKKSEKGDGGLEWSLSELAAYSSHTLRLRLIPRSGREFQLGVQWSQESAESHARVEVREPKLKMTISGPQEVLFGSPQRYRLTLSNPGTGTAEGVAVRLIPPGSDSTSAITHTVGTLGPEEVKEVELELTAREAGELILQATATAEGGLETEAIKRVLCRKPELEVDWRGPDRKYAGTETAYYFRVRNSGTATTEPVEVKVRLPEGISFLSASDSYSVDAVTGVVTWRLPTLTPREEQYVQFRCQLDRPGWKEFNVTARTIDGDVYDTASVRTEVIALADLKLEVNDPRGARPTGEPVLYEIRVVNRGTTDARGIAIIGLFSEGIDPISVEGAQNSVREGRVTFQPVRSLPAGGEILLQIRAVASQAGTHIFRAEVVCEDLDIRLAAEETTRFFEDEYRWDEGETPYTAENRGGRKRR